MCLPDCLRSSGRQKVLTLQGALPREISGSRQRLCATLQGFSLHAAVRCGAGQRKTLERLCCYITRPALANDRVQMNASGQVELRLKTPWRDGTTHQVMSPVWTTLLSRRICFLVGCLAAIHKIPSIDLHVGFARCLVI